MLLRNRFVAVAISIAAAALCMLLIAGPAPAQDLESKLEAKQAKLDQVREKKGVLTTTISRYGDQIDRLTGEVADIRGREEAVRTRLAAKQAELDKAIADLDVAKNHLVELRSRLRRALDALRDRLVAMYESGTPDVLSVIVGASGVDDLAARAEYIDRLHGMDEAVVGRVRELRNQVQRIVDRLRGTKDQIEVARDAIASEEEALASARAALQSHQQALVSARAKRVAALNQISEHEEELDGDVSAIQGKIAAQLSATGSMPLPAGPIQGGSGGLIWPVSGPVVSGFGGRDIGAGYEYHPGIDIAVPEMTPIRAAASGTVIFTQSEASSGGYGNYTCIDHGGGLSTCYAHQSSFAVAEGQSVSQGDIIGYTGCTGYCLGPHLHFEVRINGSVTDPMGYL
ncbi:MAG TPA: peptidoglycan DD-metalloendopeptidase family protein [Solirubrobacterales bacterium]|jgi:murein DD-endopeptidase MepM/ murein hydrolase activator NlpD|nr:peptidoglycan DD-metalloendopeptidase family protein [Solirubrobacterales bacterium]